MFLSCLVLYVFSLSCASPVSFTFGLLSAPLICCTCVCPFISCLFLRVITHNGTEDSADNHRAPSSEGDPHWGQCKRSTFCFWHKFSNHQVIQWLLWQRPSKFDWKQHHPVTTPRKRWNLFQRLCLLLVFHCEGWTILLWRYWIQGTSEGIQWKWILDYLSIMTKYCPVPMWLFQHLWSNKHFSVYQIPQKRKQLIRLNSPQIK